MPFCQNGEAPAGDTACGSGTMGAQRARTGRYAMRVAMVRTAAREPSVAGGRGGGWVPLLTVPGTDRLGPAAADLLAFLGADEQVRELARELVSAAPSAELVSAELAPAELSPAELAAAEVASAEVAALLAPPLPPAGFR